MQNGILLKSKQTGILIALMDTTQAWYVSSLAKATGTTYVHACNFVNVCEDMGLVNCEKHGKLKVVKLTEKGAKVAEMVSGISALINQTVQPPPAPPPIVPPKEKDQTLNKS